MPRWLRELLSDAFDIDRSLRMNCRKLSKAKSWARFFVSFVHVAFVMLAWLLNLFLPTILSHSFPTLWKRNLNVLFRSAEQDFPVEELCQRRSHISTFHCLHCEIKFFVGSSVKFKLFYLRGIVVVTLEVRNQTWK